MNKSNPNGANQYQLDPRQKLCWESYTNPKSETFGNAYQSAIKAGYEKDTANQITVTTWFLEKTRRMNLLGKAEKVLEDMLDLPVNVIKYNKRSSEDDEDSEPAEYLVTDPQLVRIKQDTAKFVASTQGKDVGYSTRSEVTGKDGSDLIPERADEEAAKAAIASFAQRSTKDSGA